MSPARFWRWMVAGAWDGDRLERMGGAVEGFPQGNDRLARNRMLERRRNLGEWAQHIGTAQQVRPRQRQVGLLAAQFAI